MKLFKATIEIDAMIAADDENEAYSIVTNEIRNIFDNEREYAEINVVEVDEILDNPWKFAIPYSKQGANEEEKSCWEILNQNG